MRSAGGGPSAAGNSASVANDTSVGLLWRTRDFATLSFAHDRARRVFDYHSLSAPGGTGRENHGLSRRCLLLARSRQAGKLGRGRARREAPSPATMKLPRESALHSVV